MSENVDELKVQKEIVQMHDRSKSGQRPLDTTLITSFTDFEEIRKGVIANVKDTLRDCDPILVELYLDLAFGGLRLTKDTLTRDETKNIREKEASARIQHAYAHCIYFASEENADSDFTRTVYELVNAGSRLSRNRILQEYTNLPKILGGIKNELAIIRALKRGGYTILLPDYAQDTTEIPDEDNEVLQWDVKSGVDFIAVKNGKAVLVDAKGRLDISEVHLDDERAIDPNWEHNDCLRNALMKIGAKTFYRTRLMIPTAGINFKHADLPTNPDDPTIALKTYGCLQPNIEDDIIRAVDRIETVSQPKVYTFG